MKALLSSIVVLLALSGAWAQALTPPGRPLPVHPMVPGTAKRIHATATAVLAPTSAQQPVALTLYDATSLDQLAYDGTSVYFYTLPAAAVFREQIPLLGPARLNALEMLYTGTGAAGSTASITIQVYGCRTGSVIEDPIASGFPLLATFTGQIPTDGTYVLTLDLGGVVYDAGVDAGNRRYSHDLVVQIQTTGTNRPGLYIANGGNSLRLRNDGGLGVTKPALFPLGTGAFWADEGNRFHYERYFIGSSDSNWREGTSTYWWGGSPMGNWSFSVSGSYNFVGKVTNNANVAMTEAKLQINGSPVTVPLEELQDGSRVFTLPLPPNVAHDVRIVMGPPYLVRAKTVTAGSPATPVEEEFVLISGDLDGDNEVTLFDFGILVSSFGEIGD